MKNIVLDRKTKLFRRENQKTILWDTMRPKSKTIVFLVFPRKKLVSHAENQFFPMKKIGFAAQNHLFAREKLGFGPKPSFREKLVFLPKTIFSLVVGVKNQLFPRGNQKTSFWTLAT